MSDKTLVERLRDEAKRAREKRGLPVYTPEKIERLADAIEREYLPRPRFEDGEPVQFGDMAKVREDLGDVIEMVYQDGKCVEVVIGFGDEETASHYTICEGERVKRPELEVLDADGVPIHKGDTVWCVKGLFFDDCECTVIDISQGKVTIARSLGGASTLQTDPINITHKKPVLDADGVPIKVGDTVWTVYAGYEHKVADVLPDGYGHNNKPCIVYESGGWDRGVSVTHRQPDTWETIIREARKADGCGSIDEFMESDKARELIERCKAYSRLVVSRER